MMNFLNSASRTSMSVLANSALITVSAGVSICAIGLTALYLIQYIDETPSMKSLQCMIGVERPDCPRHAENMKRLQAELDTIVAQRNSIEGQLAGLRAVETAIDEITLFQTHRDPSGGLDITIGTVYKEFVDAQPTPDSYFCYINLAHGVAGESRNLHFRGKAGPQEISVSKLEQVGVSSGTLSFGRSVCKPFLIGQG